MATKLWRLTIKDVNIINIPLIRHISKRKLGKPPEESTNLQKVLEGRLSVYHRQNNVQFSL